MPAFDFPHWRTITVQEDDLDCLITVEYTEHAKGCPYCGFMLLDKHGRLPNLYRDIPQEGKHVGVYVQRQRYRCQSCRKTFLQDLPDMNDDHNMTKRLVKFIEREVFKTTFLALARNIGSDEKTIRNVFLEHVKRLEAGRILTAPAWLGMDELKLAGGYRAIFSDVKNHCIVDMLEKRSKDSVKKWLAKLPDRERIELVTMDMWDPYRDLVNEFMPQAKVVVDKFHWVRMASDAMEQIRKEVRGSLTDRQRRTLMHDRFILLKRKAELEDKDKIILESWLGIFPVLKDAYEWKEELYDIWDLEDTSKATERFAYWRKDMPPSIQPAFQPMLTAYGNWTEEIWNYFKYRATNAYTEHLNGVIKIANRMGRGYSFAVIRARMLYKDNGRAGKKTAVNLLAKFGPEVATLITEVIPPRDEDHPHSPFFLEMFNGMPLSTIEEDLLNGNFYPLSTEKSE